MTNHLSSLPEAAKAAVLQAAARLKAARLPLITGLSTDVEGLRAAFRLAHVSGAVLDHAASTTLSVEFRQIAETGQMQTTPTETRHRADVLVLIGPQAVTAATSLNLLAEGPSLYDWRGQRQVVLLGTHHLLPAHGGESAIAANIELDTDSLPEQIGLLRALVNGRVSPRTISVAEGMAEAADLIKAAKFGVFVYDAAVLGALAAENILSLIRDLNKTTRFTALSIAPGQNARGALSVSAWTSGDALPQSLGRGYPVADFWRYDGARLIASGETDYVLYVGGLGGALPARADLALAPNGFGLPGAAQIEIGVPGESHDGVIFEPARDSLVFTAAARPDGRPSAAAILNAIADEITGGH